MTKLQKGILLSINLHNINAMAATAIKLQMSVSVPSLCILIFLSFLILFPIRNGNW